MKDKPILTAKEAAEYLNVCVKTIMRQLALGKIPRVKGIRKILIPRTALEKFVNGEK